MQAFKIIIPLAAYSVLQARLTSAIVCDTDDEYNKYCEFPETLYAVSGFSLASHYAIYVENVAERYKDEVWIGFDSQDNWINEPLISSICAEFVNRTSTAFISQWRVADIRWNPLEEFKAPLRSLNCGPNDDEIDNFDYESGPDSDILKVILANAIFGSGQYSSLQENLDQLADCTGGTSCPAFAEANDTSYDLSLVGNRDDHLLLCPYKYYRKCNLIWETFDPTGSPTKSPSDSPTKAPTKSPTSTPTNAPTQAPSDSPTLSPNNSPTNSPTKSPTNAPTITPTAAPTDSPTAAPTHAPTITPTAAPTDSPTKAPTHAPTITPTAAPTKSPTKAPTLSPSKTPTNAPTKTPTAAPTESPTSTPTAAPTDSPTAAPTHAPTITPTAAPTDSPTKAPTHAPTTTPTAAPIPTNEPTRSPVVVTYSADIFSTGTCADSSTFDRLDDNTMTISGAANTVSFVLLENDYTTNGVQTLNVTINPTPAQFVFGLHDGSWADSQEAQLPGPFGDYCQSLSKNGLLQNSGIWFTDGYLVRFDASLGGNMPNMYNSLGSITVSDPVNQVWQTLNECTHMPSGDTLDIQIIADFDNDLLSWNIRGSSCTEYLASDLVNNFKIVLGVIEDNSPRPVLVKLRGQL